MLKNKGLKLEWLFLTFVLALTLFACRSDERVKDLEDFVASLKKALVKHNAPSYLSTLKLPTPVSFNDSKHTRDPFVDEVSVYNGEAVGNPLLAFPLKSYEFVGLVARDGQAWAVIKAPDAKVYQLTLKDRIGNQYGRIIAIHKDYLEVEERMISEKERVAGQVIGTRVVNMPLKGGT